MQSSLTENEMLYPVLSALRTGYETGDFSSLFPFLASDCVMESMWVLTPNTGYDAVVEYLTGKGRTLARNGCFPCCTFVELVGSLNPVRSASLSLNGGAPSRGSVGLAYKDGKLCLYMSQTLNGETHGVIVDVRLDADGMVKRIDLCMPELFNFRKSPSFD